MKGTVYLLIFNLIPKLYAPKIIFSLAVVSVLPWVYFFPEQNNG
jgi:hypothetical protein